MVKRDDKWLLFRLDHIWSNHFSDIDATNKIFIKFGKFARLRLGSIRLNRKSGATLITITSMFKEEKIPIEVIDHTIAHELSHYTHGFSSLHKRKFHHPHVGGVVQKEMVGRGMGKIILEYKKWIKGYKSDLKKHYERRTWH